MMRGKEEPITAAKCAFSADSRHAAHASLTLASVARVSGEALFWGGITGIMLSTVPSWDSRRKGNLGDQPFASFTVFKGH